MNCLLRKWGLFMVETGLISSRNCILIMNSTYASLITKNPDFSNYFFLYICE